MKRIFYLVAFCSILCANSFALTDFVQCQLHAKGQDYIGVTNLIPGNIEIEMGEGLVAHLYVYDAIHDNDDPYVITLTISETEFEPGDLTDGLLFSGTWHQVNRDSNIFRYGFTGLLRAYTSSNREISFSCHIETDAPTQ